MQHALQGLSCNCVPSVSSSFKKKILLSQFTPPFVNPTIYIVTSIILKKTRKGYKRAKENYKEVNQIIKIAPNMKIIFYTGNYRYLELR